MLKLLLTDGKNNFQALEVEHISALRSNVDKALRSLQKTDSRYNNAKKSRKPQEPRGKRKKKTEDSKSSSGKISLFDFLEDKLPVQPESVETTNLSQNSYIQNNESNQDRFESRGFDVQSGRGGRNQKGGRGGYWLSTTSEIFRGP
ncbi:uncharacterized protein LOC143893296 [Temnothorax americanus]|uniref:uncharacterized protein LOC143893296 n=1 Tax=Temnothorax americanus TaxID=1964332 RepID=UPI004068A134